MKKRIIRLLLSIIFICATVSAAFPLNLDGVVAYPVPFNVNKQMLKINNPSAAVAADSIEIEIFDINGDRVLTRQYSSFNSILWNGRNGGGNKVKPGLYIIKVTAENTSTGDFGRKIIRILVDY